MNKNCYERSICKSALFVATLVIASLIADSAWAKRVSLTVTVSQLRAACSKAGGTFGVHWDGGGYGCIKANCDGKGGSCEVHCKNNNSCTGQTPTRTQQGGKPVQILTSSSGSTLSRGNPPPVKSGGVLGDGILGTGPGMGTTGPAASGAPASAGGRPSAAAPIQLR